MSRIVLLLISLLLSTQGMAQPGSNLVARYSFDAPGSGQDSTGNYNALLRSLNDTLRPPVKTRGHFCEDSGAYRFISPLQGIALPTTLPAFLRANGGGDFALSFWFRTNLVAENNASPGPGGVPVYDPNNVRSLVSSRQRTGTFEDFVLGMTNGGKVMASLGLFNNGVELRPSTRDYNDSQWHHLLFVFDRDNGRPEPSSGGRNYATVTYYIDGQVISDLRTMPSRVDPLDAPIWIGRHNWTNSLANGQIDPNLGKAIRSTDPAGTFLDIDEVRFYNQVIAPGQLELVRGMPYASLTVAASQPVPPGDYFNLSVSTGATASINGDVRLFGAVHVNGTVNVNTSGRLVLAGAGALRNSGNINVLENGSLVQSSCSSLEPGNGNFALTRTSPYPAGSLRYNYWASPMTNASAGAFANARRVNSASFGGSPVLGVFRYNVGADVAAATSNNYANYNALWLPMGGADPLEPGLGYAVAGAGAVTFRGQVNNAPDGFPLRLSLGRGTSSSSLVRWDGINLLGNPFPSPISIERFLRFNETATFENGTGIYFWLDDGNNATRRADGVNNDYANCTAAGCTPTTFDNGTDLATNNFSQAPYIAAGQGFMVRAAANNAPLIFSNGMRLTGQGGLLANTSFFREEVEATSRWWLGLRTPQGHRNELLLAFAPDYRDEIDHFYDGYKMEGNPDVSFYSLAQTEEPLAVQALPNERLRDDGTIRLGFFSATAGQHEIYLALANGTTGAWLLDKQTNHYHALANGPYQFSSEAGRFNDRFLITTRPLLADQKLSDPITGLKGQIRVGPTLVQDNFTIYFNQLPTEVLQLAVYDNLGRLVSKFPQQINQAATKPHVQPCGHWPAGVYYVSIYNHNETATWRLFKQ
jgi:Concanavalin A-like lectin/glucanases superfamily